MRDIICIGELVIDFLPGKEPFTFTQNAGGAPANVAIAAARNGLKAGMITKVGRDDFGKFLFRVLEKEGVEILSPDMTDEAVTTLAFVTLTESGERSFVFGRKPGADMFLADGDVRDEDLAETTVLHAGSFGLSGGITRETTIHVLERAHELGKIVSFDINYRNVAWKDDKEACAREVRTLLPVIDLLKVSDEEVDMLGAEAAIPALMKENGITVCALTRGADGVSCYFEGEDIFCKGYPAPVVADTTGAGDAFWGGFLSQLLHSGVTGTKDITRQLIADAADYGNISGSLCVREKGALSSLPGRDEILAYRAEHGWTAR